MSRVEAMHAIYAAFNRGDLDAFFEQTSPDVAVDAWPANLGAEPRYVGHEAVRRHFEHMLSLFDEVRFEPEKIVELRDDLMLVAVRSHVRGKGSGVPVTVRVVHLWRHADLLGLDLRVFPDERAARQAVRDDEARSRSGRRRSRRGSRPASRGASRSPGRTR